MTTTDITSTDHPLSCPDQSRERSPALPRGRLMFALDATASRAPTWAIARELQAKMFREAAPIGYLHVQLVYYGGASCRASRWKESGEELAQVMNGIACEAGSTQIGKVLTHAIQENEKAPVQALVFIGDAMEEKIDELAGKASELGKAGIPIFIFQEGTDPVTRLRPSQWRSGGQQMQSSGCTKSSSGGSRPKPCCRRQTLPLWCSGHCLLPDRLPSARSMTGRHSQPSTSINQLTSLPDSLLSKCRRLRHTKFQHNSQTPTKRRLHDTSSTFLPCLSS